MLKFLIRILLIEIGGDLILRGEIPIMDFLVGHRILGLIQLVLWVEILVLDLLFKHFLLSMVGRTSGPRPPTWVHGS